MNTLLASGQETVLRGGQATGTVISSGGYELLSSCGTAEAIKISGGKLDVAAGGTAGAFIGRYLSIQADSIERLITLLTKPSGIWSERLAQSAGRTERRRR